MLSSVGSTGSGGAAVAESAAGRSATAPRDASGQVAEGLSPLDRLSLFAIAVVLVLVTLPRIERFALRANERGAIHAVELLGAAALQQDVETIGQLFAGSRELTSTLRDVELLDDGRLLRRHGYLIRLAADGKTLVAWPWEHGRTGLGAFRSHAGGVIGHANADGRWSGVDGSPSVTDRGDAWRRLSH